MKLAGTSETSLAPDLGVIYHFDSYHNMEPKVAFSLQNIGGLDFKEAGKSSHDNEHWCKYRVRV